MTQLTQTQIRYPARTVAGIALAAVVLGGIVAGGVQALTHASSDGIPAVSARDQAVLKAAQEWETRYRQIDPSSR